VQDQVKQITTMIDHLSKQRPLLVNLMHDNYRSLRGAARRVSVGCIRALIARSHGSKPTRCS
jgi:hypothetical protein